MQPRQEMASKKSAAASAAALISSVLPSELREYFSLNEGCGTDPRPLLLQPFNLFSKITCAQA